ncbi:tetratricopeptide (TPR) repeat protein [Cryobacterium sp. MP_M5]|uniref:tetratricopeptide repeat protein n=1 Tax=unclassified Cryobacterium TaxID=2649013 RepID=UPI001A35B1E2|nr:MULTISPECIES: tetratricopeptide repeat protein [unclassified Cryobacterium]MBG6057744.1 tetratricopeptide (TPR) repeat protein [Cryobacterium sp. MP_M3]MEC5175741.1 tetratricopeptide (TPR) repeat protein [Cryobacterium sp. MP_M5]
MTDTAAFAADPIPPAATVPPSPAPRGTGPVSQALLDSLWDFTDAAASAQRFQQAADDAGRGDEARAELATQLARAFGLLGRFDDGLAALAAVQESTGEPTDRLQARVALEHGRLLRSMDRPDEAVPFFTLAVRKAASAGTQFLALDALHMLAITDTGHEEEWAAEGLALLDTATDARTRRWGVALHNNLGWFLHDSGRPEEALPEFEAALGAADTVGTHEQRHLGRWAVARCLRTLGRTDEARTLQQQLAAERPDDDFVRAELALLDQAADATGVSGAEPTIEP